jgi:ribonuclease G
MKRGYCCAHRDIRLTEIWRDDAPGERRAGLVENGKIVEIHIQRDLHLVLGEYGVGRIDRKTPSGAYIATDGGEEVLLRGKCGKNEGARVVFEITREAIAEPGRIKPPEGKFLDEPAAITAVDAAASKEALWCKRLSALGADTDTTNPVGGAFDCAIYGQSVVGDVIISFQRTKAGLVFDVDGVGDPLALNLIAAAEIARLLRLYQVGGMTMIDFVSVESKEHRKTIADAFDRVSASDRPFERSAINGYGLMQVVRARPRPSVLDHLFGARIATLSDETQALLLLREAACSSGFGSRRVTARPAVAALLTTPKWHPFVAQCERLTGASLQIVADNRLTGYGHVHVAQS